MSDQGWNAPGGGNNQGFGGPAGTPPPPTAPQQADQGWGTPNAGQGTPPAQQPYGSPQGYGGATPGAGDSDMMKSNIAAAVSYFFIPLGGLIVFFTHKNPESRFHAMQSILYGAASFVLLVALWILVIAVSLGNSDIGGLLSMVVGLLGTAISVGMIVFTIFGFQGKHFELPVIGGLAKKWSS